MTKYVENVNDIINVVSDEYGIPAIAIMTPSVRTPPVAHARHVAIYLACKMTWLSKREIAACFNQCDHSSLYYGFNKISVAVAKDEVVKKRIGELTQKLTPA